MIDKREFEQIPLRVHTFLDGVSIHDAWMTELPRYRSGITLSEFQPHGSIPSVELSPVARALLRFRFFIGRLFRWDPESSADFVGFASRLTADDRRESEVPPGTSQGPFRVVYRFANEELVEVLNRTVHAAAVTALVETPDAYRYYFGIYVRNVSRLTPLYMALIAPFRRLIVYPSMLRSVRANWDKMFGTDNAQEGA